MLLLAGMIVVGGVGVARTLLNCLVVTNLTYASVQGTNEVIYVQAEGSEKYFGVFHQ